MPLVRIDVVEGRTDEELRALADTVHGVMLDVFAAPPGDRYQVVHAGGRAGLDQRFHVGAAGSEAVDRSAAAVTVKSSRRPCCACAPTFASK